jgi:hypothetical protein
MGLGSQSSEHDAEQEFSNYHALISAVMQVGLGRTNHWVVQCVELHTGDRGKIIHKRITSRKIKLAQPMFSTPQWLWTDCGAWWASLAGLNRDAVFRLAGGVGKHRASCGPNARCKHKDMEVPCN